MTQQKMLRFFDSKNPINFIRFFYVSLYMAVFVIIMAIVGYELFGINMGIEFRGGVEMQIQFKSKDNNFEWKIRDILMHSGVEKYQVQAYGVHGNSVSIKMEPKEIFSKNNILDIEKDLKRVGLNVEINQSEGIVNGLNIRIAGLDKAGVNELEFYKNLIIKNEQCQKFKLHNNIGFSKVSYNNLIQKYEIEYGFEFAGDLDRISNELMSQFGNFEVKKMDFLDSQISYKLQREGLTAVLCAIIVILFYIFIRFDVMYVPGAVVCLLQDLSGAFFVFIFGRYEFDMPSIAAMLTIIGVSINNTIIVYDRIRAEAPKTYDVVTKKMLLAYVNKAVNDTFSRTINTSLTVLLSSVSLWMFAGASLKSFSIGLTVGLVFGVFSSIFAAPALYIIMVHSVGQKLYLRGLENKNYAQYEKEKGII